MNRLFRLEIWIWNNISEDYEISPKIMKISPKITELSPKITELSPKVTKISPKVMQTSPKVSIQQHALKGQKLLAQGNTLGIR